MLNGQISKERTRTIKRQAKLIECSTRDLLDYNRPIEPFNEAFNVNDLIRESIDIVS